MAEKSQRFAQCSACRFILPINDLNMVRFGEAVFTIVDFTTKFHRCGNIKGRWVRNPSAEFIIKNSLAECGVEP